MKMGLMRKPPLPLAFALILALTAISLADDICLDPPDPKPDIWFDCWDCPYQCHGDADCQAEYMGRYRVYINDLAIIRNVYLGGNWPARYPEDFNYDPCADFDRDFDVDDCDMNILEDWLGNSAVPADCPGQPPLDPLNLQPLEEDLLFAGQNYTIGWQDARTGGCAAHKYMLYYSTDAGGNWLPVDTNSIDNVCSYNWLVPPVPSDQCLLRIDDLDDPAAVTDTLDEFFTIVECSSSGILALQKPAPGQFVLAEADCTITWSDCRLNKSQTPSYKLYYSTDLGKPWEPIDSNSINATFYNWPVPSDLDGACYLAIHDANDATIGDIMSDGFYIYHCDQTMPGDIDGNCYVDFRDYGMLVSNWPLDLDFGSIIEFAEQWCNCENPYDPACDY